MPRTAALKRTFNKDGSISLRFRGRVVLRAKGVYAFQDVENFKKGWYAHEGKRQAWIAANPDADPMNFYDTL